LKAKGVPTEIYEMRCIARAMLIFDNFNYGSLGIPERGDCSVVPAVLRSWKPEPSSTSSERIGYKMGFFPLHVELKAQSQCWISVCGKVWFWGECRWFRAELLRKEDFLGFFDGLRKVGFLLAHLHPRKHSSFALVFANLFDRVRLPESPLQIKFQMNILTRVLLLTAASLLGAVIYGQQQLVPEDSKRILSNRLDRCDLLSREIKARQKAISHAWRDRLVSMEGESAAAVRAAHAEFLRERFDTLVELERKRLELAVLEEQIDADSPSLERRAVAAYRREIGEAVSNSKTPEEKLRIQAERIIGERIIALESSYSANGEG